MPGLRRGLPGAVGEVLAMEAATLFEELDRLVGGVALDQLPTLLGRLTETEARVRLRLTLASLPHPDTAGSDENLPIGEAAKRLGMSKDFLYRKAASLPFTVRIGSRLLFSARGMDRWIKQRTGRS